MQPAPDRARFTSPLGTLQMRSTDKGITELIFLPRTAADERPRTPFLRDAVRQVQEYLEGDRHTFKGLVFDLQGTPFQIRVWQALLAIPYGQVVTYGDVARQVDSGPRAIGGAVGKNPVCIIVPCHRVIAAGGKEGGFSSGIERKRWLMRREGVVL